MADFFHYLSNLETRIVRTNVPSPSSSSSWSPHDPTHRPTELTARHLVPEAKQVSLSLIIRVLWCTSCQRLCSHSNHHDLSSAWSQGLTFWPGMRPCLFGHGWTCVNMMMGWPNCPVSNVVVSRCFSPVLIVLFWFNVSKMLKFNRLLQRRRQPRLACNFIAKNGNRVLWFLEANTNSSFARYSYLYPYRNLFHKLVPHGLIKSITHVQIYIMTSSNGSDAA